MEIVRDFSSFLCFSFGVGDDANDRSIARSVALSPVVVSLRETVDEIWVEITSMVYTVCSYKMSFTKSFLFSTRFGFGCAIGFFLLLLLRIPGYPHRTGRHAVIAASGVRSFTWLTTR